MKPEDLSVLAERASTVEGRPAERVDEVRARIAVARRRRQVGAVGSAVVAVVLALTAGVGLLAVTHPDDSGPVKPAPRPTPTVLVEEAPSVRRLTYAIGDKIHWGDRVIDVGGEVSQLTATDDGVVFVRSGAALPTACRHEGVTGGCDALWFTDGFDVVRIGSAFGTVIRGFRTEFSSAGSTVVWFEPGPDDRPLADADYREVGEYVVYDTAKRHEVARFGTADSDIEAAYDDYVYWTPQRSARPWCLDFAKYYGVCRRHGRVMRLDTKTGTQQQVPWASYIADRRNRPRLFIGPTDKPDSPYNPFPANRPGSETIRFGRQGDRLVAEDGSGGVSTARVASTGEVVRLRIPNDYPPDVDAFSTVSWLDDDRVVLMANDRLLVCRLPDGRCRAAVERPVIADFAGRG